MSQAESFEDFETLWQKPLMQFAAKIVISSGGTIEDAEEVYANSRLRAMRHFDQYHPQKKYWTWRCQIILNVWIDERRRHKKHPIVSLDTFFSGNGDDRERLDLPDPDIDVENHVIESIIRSSNWKQIRLAFLSKSSVFFQCLKLYYCDGLSCEEVADVLHCPLSTVRVRLHRARKLLRQKIANGIIAI